MNNLNDINILDERDKTEILNDLKNIKIGVDFETSGARELPESGENIVAIVSKIVKYLEDLKEISFTGDYNDISNTPVIRSIESIIFTSSTKGDEAGIAGATDVYTINYTDTSTDTFSVYNGEDGKSAEVIIDTELNNYSNNPVENKVIKAEIDKILQEIEENTNSISEMTSTISSIEGNITTINLRINDINTQMITIRSSLDNKVDNTTFNNLKSGG